MKCILGSTCQAVKAYLHRHRTADNPQVRAGLDVAVTQHQIDIGNMAITHAHATLLGAQTRERVLALLRRFGYSANSFQALQDQFEYWFYGESACIAYIDTGAAWVVVGAPIAEATLCRKAATEFIQLGRARGKRVAFFGTEARFADACGLSSILVGTQPSFTVHDWRDRSSRGRELRRQVRRAHTQGLQIAPTIVSDSTHGDSVRAELERLIRRWLDSKPLPPMGFLTRMQPFSFATERLYFAARSAHALVGLAVLTPIYARRGWLIENLIRIPEAPNGTIESLIDAAVTTATDAGSEFVTLGLTPLAGNVTGFLRTAKRLGAPLYNFVGVERFRSKLRPSVWSPVYLTYAEQHAAPVAVYDCLVAFANGSLTRFATQIGLRWLHTRRPVLAESQ